VVLDASALLAYWFDEEGAAVVTVAIASEGAVIGTPNLAEALTKVVDRRPDLAADLRLTAIGHAGDPAQAPAPLPLAGGAIAVEPFTETDAIISAQVREATRDRGLSLGDRSCLALALRTDQRVLTADAAWTGLTLDVRIEVIR
jgi:PIN domain nuclease of toxin-antitoxin system